MNKHNLVIFLNLKFEPLSGGTSELYTYYSIFIHIIVFIFRLN